MPAGPMNLSRWGGIMLRPRLFVALYFFSRINFSSSYVIKCGVGSTSGEYLSGWISSLKKISLLKVVKAPIGMGLSLPSLYFSICQNYFGLYFNIYGNSCDNFALLYAHNFLNLRYAILVCSCFLPYNCFASL
jgi:hypothetical protein